MLDILEGLVPKEQDKTEEETIEDPATPNAENKAADAAAPGSFLPQPDFFFKCNVVQESKLKARRRMTTTAAKNAPSSPPDTCNAFTCSL